MGNLRLKEPNELDRAREERGRGARWDVGTAETPEDVKSRACPAEVLDITTLPMSGRSQLPKHPLAQALNIPQLRPIDRVTREKLSTATLAASEPVSVTGCAL